MTRFIQTWDGGTGASNGVTITAGTTNGTGNTPITSTAQNAPALATFSSAFTHSGSLAALMTYTSTTALYIVINTAVAVGTRAAYRNYVYVPSASSGKVRRFFEIRNSGGVAMTVNMTTGDQIMIANQAGVTQYTSTATFSFDTWVRLEVAMTVGSTSSTGSADFAFYLGDSTTPIESISLTSQNFGTTAIAVMRLGSSAGQVTQTWYHDDYSWDTNLASGFIGPSVTAASGDIKVYNGTAWVAKPMKVWNGAAWVVKPVKVYNGTAWVLTNY